MWLQVEADLARFLDARIYPNLLSDTYYRRFLALAGMPLEARRDISPALRRGFSEAAKMNARMAVATVSRTGGIEEATACAKVFKSPTTLYRFWDATAPEFRVGIWWFEKQVVDLAKLHGGRGSVERKEWLRRHLAVSLDWSRMNRIDVIRLDGDDELPAIEGNGTPQRMYSASALYRGKAPREEYWKNLQTYFPGGVKQIALPFIPRSIGEDLNRFLSHG